MFANISKPVFRKALFGAFLVAGFFYYLFQKPDLVLHQFEGSTMGTTYHIKVVLTENNPQLQNLKDAIHSVLDDVNKKMSTYQASSEISQFNQNKPGEWFDVSGRTFEVVSLGQKISRESEGYYDMTVGPLVNLWGFGPDLKPTHIPDQGQLDNAKKRVGYRALHLREETKSLSKDKDIYLDLSSIAKGYAVDQVADILIKNNVTRFMVEVGGEIRVMGLKPDQRKWRLAIESPEVMVRQIHNIIEVDNASVATSGDYRNYYEEDGIRYSHTINPKTGMPINHKTASVTVITKNCAEADAYATLLMVLGKESGLQFAKKHDLAAYFIVREGESFNSYYSEQFSPYLMKEER